MPPLKSGPCGLILGRTQLVAFRLIRSRSERRTQILPRFFAGRPPAPEDPNRFLAVCALVSDLYCPGYNPNQSVEKNSNPARVAAALQVDSAWIATAVRTELAKEKSKVKNESQPAQKVPTAKPARKPSR